MSADGTPAPQVPEPDQRRRVRVFVAVHVAAVGGLYALALLVGGGHALPTMPLAAGAPRAPVAGPAPVPAAAERIATPTPAPPPAWTETAELSAPWDSR